MTSDVLFYTASGTTWTTSMTATSSVAYGGSFRQFEPAAIHELGHAGYSVHSLTQIFVPGTVTLKSSTGLSDGQRRYIINDGDSVDVEFTYENNGRSEQTPRVGFYLSTNDNITGGDTFLGSSHPTLGRNDVYTRSYTIRIPAGTVAGFYWLGAYIDDDFLISEFDGNNNTASIPIEVR